MEGVDHQINKGNSGPGSGRWNPTKEQISMLENLYKQGLRTPTAQQIQQITARLQAFGHIEGKNVFYWFQNHKARQRQKQKLEHNNNLAINFNRFLLNQPPIFAPYTQNAQCYIPPQTELGFYQHYPKVPPPEAAGYKRRLIPESMDPSYERHNKAMQQSKRTNGGHDHQETLDLFPMHPTGILQAKNSSSTTTTTTSTSSSDQNDGNNSNHHDVFNFFYGKLN